jgi:hypothetical protein
VLKVEGIANGAEGMGQRGKLGCELRIKRVLGLICEWLNCGMVDWSETIVQKSLCQFCTSKSVKILKSAVFRVTKANPFTLAMAAI